MENNEQKRETVGKVYLDLVDKIPDTRDPIELEREMHKSFPEEIYARIEQDKRLYTSDFYVVVLRKQERLMSLVFRNYIFTRWTCPTPQYDQTAYKYHKKADRIEFLWVVPDLETCIMFKNDPLNVIPAERELLGYVTDFFNGTLDARAMIYNGEVIIQ